MPAVVKNDRNELFTVDEFVAYLDGLDTASARQALHIRYQHPSLTTGANETFDGVPLFYLARDTLRDWNGEDLSWTVTQGEGPPGFRELTYAMISEGHRYWLNPSQYVRYRELGLKSNVRYSIKTDGDEIVFEAMVVQRPKLDTRRVPVKVVLTLEES
ncbi:MAG: hypothetical protein IH945_09045 [Armatimonadetes bacterium]|nr:hypothetical protein [Armatimonadota bacterium]